MPDADRVLFKALENPTKLNIIFLLSRHERMTVTQMAEHVRVGKPNLYHFVNQMVKDGLLSKPEVQVKRNYVEKYYRLNRKPFESLSSGEQRRLMKSASPEKVVSILRSGLAAIGLELRLIAEEYAHADREVMQALARSVADERVSLSYAILSDEAYDYVVSELRKISKTVDKRWGDQVAVGGNRIILFALPGTPTVGLANQ